MAGLSTHVLDTARGIPARGMVVDLDVIENGARRRLATFVTNAGGRTDQPLLAAEAMMPGVFELTFHAGDYFRGAGIALANPPFLDQVTVRFGIADPSEHYHVPLLLSPYSYSTYRGS